MTPVVVPIIPAQAMVEVVPSLLMNRDPGGLPGRLPRSVRALGEAGAGDHGPDRPPS